MNDESEVEQTARAVRHWGRIALFVALGCTGAVILGVLVLLAALWAGATWIVG